MKHDVRRGNGLVRAVVAMSTILFAASVLASDALPTDKDPLAQSRAVRLAEQLRCLVCQNQTIAESNADLAVDLRRQVREQIAAGRSDAEILDYMTARYGDFVLYKPPLRAQTLLLWAGPALLLLGGIAIAWRVATQRRGAAAAALSAGDRLRASALLDADSPKSGP